MVDAKKSPVSIAQKWCKGCGICVEFCPKEVLELDSKGKSRVKNPEDCNGCKQCELRCPDFAIVVKKEENEND